MARRWIAGLLIVGFLWVIVNQHAQIEDLLRTLSRGRWQWVAAATLIQAVYLVVFSATYQSAFSIVEVQSQLRDLVPVTLGSLFVNVVAPAGGASGAALFIDDAARRGQAPGRATAGMLLQLISDFSAFTLILVVGMLYLFFQHNLEAYEVAAALVLLLITLGLSAVLLVGLSRQDLLRRLLSGVQRLGDSLKGKISSSRMFPEDWAEKTSAEFGQAAEAISRNPGRLTRTLSLALAAHLLDLLCLYTLFLAFYGPIRLGPLVAGYAMGILFWIVSPIPQGIGIVEGVMTLAFTSLGVPGGVSATVSLAFRGLAFWLPLVLGFILLRRVKSFGLPERTLAKGWGLRLLTLSIALMGIINVLSAVTPALAGRMVFLAKYFPLAVRRGGHLTAALAGFALLVLAEGLWRRKRAAWLLAMAVLLLSMVSHLIKGLDYEEGLLAAGLAVWLWSLRYEFHARSDPPSIRQGIRTLVTAVLFTLAYGVAGFYLLDHHYTVNFSFGDAVRQTMIMFTQFYNPGLQPVTGFGRYFAASIYIIGAATLGFALLMLIRPVVLRKPATLAERERARGIVEAFGCSSLARFTLFDDKSYYFSPGGSFVAFAKKERVAVALGDPIGPAQDLRPVILGFKAYCEQNDWQAAFYQVLPDNLEEYRRAGFEVLCIGEEAIVDLKDFTLEGKIGKPLRTPYNHLTRLGYQARLHEPPLADSLMSELRSISDEWLAMMHGSEKRFSLGWFEDAYIRNSAVMAVHTPGGSISAFTNLVPEYRKNEANIDLMRRRQDTESGTMEFLFVALLQWAQSRGFDTFNLGLSALSGVGETRDSPNVEQALRYIYRHFNQFYNFQGLHEFKKKFHPHWSPRYLIYPGQGSLLPVVLALIQADAGENLVLGYLKNRGDLSPRTAGP